MGVLGILITVLPTVLAYPMVLDPEASPRMLVQAEIINLALGWFVIALPLAVGIAILRYRLWDIDILIRKTLIYTFVVALLALVYFGSVILLQRMFEALSGEQSEIKTVLSTLVIAVLFVPLRNRIQNLIDQRFYRKKYDAQQVLQDFANTVRDETDLEKLTARLMQVVNETMQPKTVSVWLKEENSGPKNV